jgi:hypothetical protein
MKNNPWSFIAKMYKMRKTKEDEKVKIHCDEPETTQESLSLLVKEKPRQVFELLEIVTKRVEEEAFTLQLSKAEMDFLELLVKNNPVIFKDIHKEIRKIIEDNTLNIHDIPDLVLILSKIFHIHFIENYIEELDLTNIIEYIMFCILDLGYLDISSENIEILKRVVKTSIVLLKTNVTIEKEIICCQGLLSLFSKK